jgi:capsular exopolysaccharide synthesis family protein
MIKMRPAFEAAIRKLDLRVSPTSLQRRTEVTAEGQTNIITVRVQDGDPQRAAKIANTIAEEYAVWVRNFSRARIEAAAQQVEAQLEEVRDELLLMGSGSKTSEKEKMALQIAGQDYAGLSEQFRQLKIREEMEIGPVQVVNTAAVPKEPVSPKPVRNGVLGLVVGLIFGVGVAFVIEMLDNTVKTSDELATITGAPVLGLVPLRKGEDLDVSVSSSATSPVAEAFRGIRNSLDFINFKHDIHAVLVTSAAPSEGKSTVAASLASGLARTGTRVVLVSVDFHRPKSATYLGGSESMGLSHVLSGQYRIDQAVQVVGEDGLVVLASGKVPPNPSELLGSEQMGRLVEDLKARADWVILDGPPVLAVADTTAVSKWVDGTIMVVRSGKTGRDALTRAVDMMSGVGAKLIGAVMIGVSGESEGSVAYAYSTYSSYARKHSSK